jgi:hypothetical protein
MASASGFISIIALIAGPVLSSTPIWAMYSWTSCCEGTLQVRDFDIRQFEPRHGGLARVFLCSRRGEVRQQRGGRHRGRARLEEIPAGTCRLVSCILLLSQVFSPGTQFRNEMTWLAQV